MTHLKIKKTNLFREFVNAPEATWGIQGRNCSHAESSGSSGYRNVSPPLNQMPTAASFTFDEAAGAWRWPINLRKPEVLLRGTLPEGHTQTSQALCLLHDKLHLPD